MSKEDVSAEYKLATTPRLQDDRLSNDVEKQPVNNEEIEGCSIAFMLLICAPKMAMNMAWAAQWAALGPLLETLISPSAVQAVQIVGPTSGLLVAPTIGVLSDACTSRFGRRRPFLFFGCITSVMCWFIMMFAKEIGESLGDDFKAKKTTYTTFFTILCYIWMDITVNLTQTPAGLIVADFAGNRQVTAAAIQQVYSIAGSFAVSGYILFFGPAHESIHSFISMLIVIMLVTCLPVCFFAKEKQFTPSNTESSSKKIKESFFAVYTGLRTLPKLLAIFAVCFVLIQYGYTAYNGAKGQFFGLVVKGGDSKGAGDCKSTNACTRENDLFNEGVRLAGGVTDTIFNVLGLFYSACLPFLVRKFGVRNVFMVSIIPQALLIILSVSKNITLDVILVVLTAISQSTVFPMQIPVILHVIGQGEHNGLGLYAGAFNSANCAGQFLNFIFASVLVTSSMGHALPVLVGGILSAIGFFVAFFFFKIEMYSL